MISYCVLFSDTRQDGGVNAMRRDIAKFLLIIYTQITEMIVLYCVIIRPKIVLSTEIVPFK